VNPVPPPAYARCSASPISFYSTSLMGPGICIGSGSQGLQIPLLIAVPVVLVLVWLFKGK